MFAFGRRAHAPTSGWSSPALGTQIAINDFILFYFDGILLAGHLRGKFGYHFQSRIVSWNKSWALPAEEYQRGLFVLYVHSCSGKFRCTCTRPLVDLGNCSSLARLPIYLRPYRLHPSMENATIFPLDLLYYVVDILGADRDSMHSRDALKGLSLTCKVMVPICRRYLFSKIILRSAHHRIYFPWRNSRNEFLLSHPTITTHYLKALEIETTRAFSTSDYELLRVISEKSPLTSVTISSTCDWKRISWKTEASILSLMQKPLEMLHIHGNFCVN